MGDVGGQVLAGGSIGGHPQIVVSLNGTTEEVFLVKIDMSGNASEWEDSCGQSQDGSARIDPCLLRGGSIFHTPPDAVSCTGLFSTDRAAAFDDLGFRCCGP